MKRSSNWNLTLAAVTAFAAFGTLAPAASRRRRSIMVRPQKSDDCFA